ncbi:hypothetical protein CDO52_13130 [Nocardiopsis gilva YIM 90087]|uniref:Uncharacterized protein n=1 Tax=Nocardiopsis gilva YIM 90087 TaxID=1235441 RepID=A0A223S665_9ACTN|nr:hypothetical protein [Nocardiopsis gilva]ASU83610.1 hypothetical protein CDO52_13130 [Nocardiopsis gilva YIM 90087]
MTTTATPSRKPYWEHNETAVLAMRALRRLSGAEDDLRARVAAYTQLADADAGCALHAPDLDAGTPWYDPDWVAQVQAWHTDGAWVWRGLALAESRDTEALVAHVASRPELERVGQALARIASAERLAPSLAYILLGAVYWHDMPSEAVDPLEVLVATYDQYEE